MRAFQFDIWILPLSDSDRIQEAPVMRRPLQQHRPRLVRVVDDQQGGEQGGGVGHPCQLLCFSLTDQPFVRCRLLTELPHY